MKITIEKCSACGNVHADLRIDALPEPEDGYTHAGACPIEGRIVYVKFEMDAEAHQKIAVR